MTMLGAKKERIVVKDYEIDYELFFTRNLTRDYLGNQSKKHSVGDNQLEDYKLMELQYGGVTRGFQPFNGFERFADYLWR
jgi:hypothetical protein